MPRRIQIFLALFLISGISVAQQRSDSLSNLRIKKVFAVTDSIVLDSFMVVPQSISIIDLPGVHYNFDYTTGVIHFKENLADSVTVMYRVFPFRTREMKQRFNYDSIRYNFTAESPYTLKDRGNQERIVDFGEINYNGSFGRGISFGNNQDAVVNSTLNMQINGFIGDSLEFTAAISDNNIPVQPDGNTQNIQDFERIFMQVKKHGWQLNFGDIDIRQTENRYLNFFRRLQGASFLTDNSFKNGNKNSLAVSGAVTKGKFTRNVITPQEGNQGPYKLTGGNNEIYFAVIAGTERVYIDGQLLERGEDRDYVIDYNLAEISFTPRRLITKDSRIQVEFEYSDRNFLNSLIYAKNDFSIKDKWNFSVGVYSNTDAKNSPINQTLSTDQKYFLSTIGNNIDQALYPNATPDTFSVNRILYKKVDTTFNGITDSIYVFSIDQNEQLYSLSFTNVGAGKGNYISSGTNANGRVFEWIAPVDGHSQGEWEPVAFLVTPKKHQVFSGSAEHKLGKNTVVNITGAVSDYNVNTFSSVDNKENHGGAIRFEINDKRPLAVKDDGHTDLDMKLDYEYVDHRFKSIETLRNVEFYRDWGLEILSPAADEKLLQFQAGVSGNEGNYIRYQFANYHRNTDYNGIRNAVENIYEKKGWRFENRIFLTSMNSDLFSGRFFRPTISISKEFESLSNYQAGIIYSSENNKQIVSVFDTLSPTSFAFTQWNLFLKSDQSKSERWGISYFSRRNYIPGGEDFAALDRSDNISLETELMGNDSRQLRMNATYRRLHTDTTVVKGTSADDKSLLGRVEYTFNEWKGVLDGGVFYELGAGQEQKREYTYLEVPAGQGYYTWIDYNEDGIPQLDEFEIAVFEDQKRWVRILTPTNQYIKANYIQFNYHLSFNPRDIRNDGSFMKFIKRFNTVSALQVNKKEISQGDFLFNPFGRPLNDTSLVSMTSFLSNTIYFNRASSVWGMDLTHRVNTSKAILSYGYESNRIRDLGWRGRFNLSKSINTTFRTNFKRRVLIVPAFISRNYSVKESEIEPSLSYTHKSNFRASLFYGIEHKRNDIGTKENSVNKSLTAELRYNAFSSGVVNAKMSLNNIHFEGNPNSPVGFIILDGLLPGNNLLWNIELSKRLPGNIELNLQYEGRKPADGFMIHTGRATLRAIF